VKRKRRVLRVVFVFFALLNPVFWVARPALSEIWNLQMTPAPPAVLLMGTNVEYSFDYFGNGAGTLEGICVTLQAADGSPVSQPMMTMPDPEGHVSGTFTVAPGARASATVRRIVVDASFSNGCGADHEDGWGCWWLDEYTFDAPYYFGDSGTITNIRLSPVSPANLLINDKVTVSFDYGAVYGGKAGISFRPWSNNTPVANYSGEDSYLYGGSTEGAAWFTLSSPGTIDEVQVRIYNPDGPFVLADLRFPVSIIFADQPTSTRPTTWGRLKAYGVMARGKGRLP
jgi:hypothetical protein